MVVRVGLAVGDRVELVEDPLPAEPEVAAEQLVLRRVVPFGLREGDAVLGRVGQAEAEAVGLDAIVAGPFLAGRAGFDARQEAAARVAGDDVGVDRQLELVADRVRGLDAVERLAIFGIRLATDRERHAGGGHQVPLVGRVDEDGAAIGPAVEGGHRRDAFAVHRHAAVAIEPGVADDRDLVLGDEGLEGELGDVGLEGPLGVGLGAVLAVVGRVLEGPGLGLVVVGLEAAVELAGDAADGVLAARVGPAEAAAGHAAEVLIGRDDHDRLAHPSGLHRRGDPGGGAAVDDHVVGVGPRSVVGCLGRADQDGQQQRRDHGRSPVRWLVGWLPAGRVARGRGRGAPLNHRTDALASYEAPGRGSCPGLSRASAAPRAGAPTGGTGA